MITITLRRAKNFQKNEDYEKTIFTFMCDFTYIMYNSKDSLQTGKKGMDLSSQEIQTEESQV